jgi:hypothetical protein
MHVKTNPKKCVAVIGLLAAILSCYPVVFFGKSFVSPVGVAKLYPHSPHVPGFQTVFQAIAICAAGLLLIFAISLTFGRGR